MLYITGLTFRCRVERIKLLHKKPLTDSSRIPKALPSACRQLRSCHQASRSGGHWTQVGTPETRQTQVGTLPETEGGPPVDRLAGCDGVTSSDSTKWGQVHKAMCFFSVPEARSGIQDNNRRVFLMKHEYEFQAATLLIVQIDNKHFTKHIQYNMNMYSKLH